MKSTIIGNRRFTCLTPTLVRIEFSPDATFEDRRSMVAYAEKSPIPFAEQTADGGWTVLQTGKLEIRTCRNDQPCDRNTLEIRWSDGQILQIWRPDDRDYQNLGGTLRSLDRYSGDSSALDGVHPATMESPDVSATTWPAWLQCEVDPLYTDLHPDAPEGFGRGHWLREAERNFNEGKFVERTFNWYKEARKFSPGILSRSGYYFLNDSVSALLDPDDFPIEREKHGCQDWYFFAYGKDLLQALRDFRTLSGPAPIPTHRSMGIIFSRWPAFTETEIQDMVRDFAANGYPLATLVMDMEWHKEGWGHWEFNPELIPDPAGFFALCKKHNLEVVFNDHPLDVRDDDCHYQDFVKKAGAEVEIRERKYNEKSLKMAKVDICNKEQNRAFLKICSNPILELGLDYWWNDGSRGQMRGTAGQLVTNKTFFESSSRNGLRGMLFARHGGLGSHRYGSFFTGDANSDWFVLRLQCEFNIRAAGAGLSHISHDIGGFMVGRNNLLLNQEGTKIINPVRYLRWLQFGVFGPILRFHCAPGSGSRLPYDYDGEVGGACRHWLRIRHSLLPYLYTAADTFHQTGIPLVQGLYLYEPDNPESYRFDQFYFGPSMFVAPVLSEESQRTFYLPSGDWWEFDSAKKIEGGRELTVETGPRTVPAYVRAGGILPRQDPDGDIHAPHLSKLILDLYPGADGEAPLYEDDGRSSDYLEGKFCRSLFRWKDNCLSGEVCEGSPLGKTRSITVRIRLDEAPTRILLNQKTELTASGENGIFTVEIPELPAAEPWSLRFLS